MQILHQSYDLFATTLFLATCYKVHWKCSKTTVNFTSTSLVAVAGSRDGMRSPPIPDSQGIYFITPWLLEVLPKFLRTLEIGKSALF